MSTIIKSILAGAGILAPETAIILGVVLIIFYSSGLHLRPIDDPTTQWLVILIAIGGGDYFRVAQKNLRKTLWQKIRQNKGERKWKQR